MTDSIKLTPDILLANGFVVDEGGDFVRDGFKIFSGHHEFWDWRTGISKKIETVDELKINYKQRTGKDLEINF